MVITNCPAKKTTTCPGMTCQECQNLQDRRKEDEEIADRMRDYWKCQQAGME